MRPVAVFRLRPGYVRGSVSMSQLFSEPLDAAPMWLSLIGKMMTNNFRANFGKTRPFWQTQAMMSWILFTTFFFLFLQRHLLRPAAGPRT